MDKVLVINKPPIPLQLSKKDTYMNNDPSWFSLVSEG